MLLSRLRKFAAYCGILKQNILSAQRSVEVYAKKKEMDMRGAPLLSQSPMASQLPGAYGELHFYDPHLFVFYFCIPDTHQSLNIINLN